MCILGVVAQKCIMDKMAFHHHGVFPQAYLMFYVIIRFSNSFNLLYLVLTHIWIFTALRAVRRLDIFDEVFSNCIIIVILPCSLSLSPYCHNKCGWPKVNCKQKIQTMWWIFILLLAFFLSFPQLEELFSPQMSPQDSYQWREEVVEDLYFKAILLIMRSA